MANTDTRQLHIDNVQKNTQKWLVLIEKKKEKEIIKFLIILNVRPSNMSNFAEFRLIGIRMTLWSIYRYEFSKKKGNVHKINFDYTYSVRGSRTEYADHKLRIENCERYINYTDR